MVTPLRSTFSGATYADHPDGTFNPEWAQADKETGRTGAGDYRARPDTGLQVPLTSFNRRIVSGIFMHLYDWSNRYHVFLNNSSILISKGILPAL